MIARGLARRVYFRAHSLVRVDVVRRKRLTEEMRAGRARYVQVVNLHGTTSRDARPLRRQLAWLKRHFQVLDFESFKSWWEPGFSPADPRPAVLLTFDDGFASNYHVAAPILEEAGLRAMFFVNPGFCAYDRATAERALRPLARPRARVVTDEDWILMSPAQLADLARRGHTIGNHTLTHANLGLTPGPRLGHQILDSARLLAEWCGKPVEAFAWTFAWDAIRPEAWRLVVETHPFCFSACPGVTNTLVDRPSLIWRTNVEASFPPALYRFVYSGLYDRRYAPMRERLRALLR